jgi:hypothetical protein
LDFQRIIAIVENALREEVPPEDLKTLLADLSSRASAVADKAEKLGTPIPPSLTEKLKAELSTFRHLALAVYTRQ